MDGCAAHEKDGRMTDDQALRAGQAVTPSFAIVEPCPRAAILPFYGVINPVLSEMSSASTFSEQSARSRKRILFTFKVFSRSRNGSEIYQDHLL